MRDPVKAKARKQRYLDKKKIEKFGPDSLGKNMSGRHGNHARGSSNARWNGGRYRSTEGYIAVAVPEGHHLRQGHGYAYEHDLIAEQMLGRPLKANEVVHHKNGIRDDNREENLEVTTRSDHAREHFLFPSARDAQGRFIPGGRTGEDLRVQEWPR